MTHARRSAVSTRRRWGRLALLLVGLSALSLGLGWARWRYLEHGFTTISPGAVYQSAEMPVDDLIAVAAERGIKTVLDLREEPVRALEAERGALETAGVRYVNLPTPQIPTDDTVDAFLELVQQDGALPILIHCEHGRGRSVLFAAIYRIEIEGWDNEAACESTRFFAWRGAFRAGSEKGDYLRAYQRRLPRL